MIMKYKLFRQRVTKHLINEYGLMPSTTHLISLQFYINNIKYTTQPIEISIGAFDLKNYIDIILAKTIKSINDTSTK